MKNFRIQTSKILNDSTSCKCKAFTLAEVLITLAIIGVVAAMTLPTLIQKHQKKVWATKFQQSLSILSQGFQKMMADEEVTDLRDTEYYKLCANANDHISDSCEAVLKKYFKVVQVLSGEDEYEKQCKLYLAYEYDENPLSKDEFRAMMEDTCRLPQVVLSNGMNIRIMDPEWIILDTNGDAKPNVYSRDLFFLAAYYNHKIFSDYFMFTIPCSSKSKPNYYIDDEGNVDYDNIQGDLRGCAADLIKNNFVMDY